LNEPFTKFFLRLLCSSGLSLVLFYLILRTIDSEVFLGID